MTQTSSAPGRQFRGRLARRLVATLLPLTLLPLLLLGTLSFSRARQILVDQVGDTLTRLEERQTEEINRWLANRRERFNFFYIPPETENAIRLALLAEGDRSAEGFEQARQTVLETLENVNSGGTLFHQFLLVDLQGTVVVASNPNLEGTSLADQPYFEALNGSNAALAVYAPTPITNALAVIISRPYLGADGIPRATFWGVSGLSLFEDILFGSETIGARHYVVTNDGHYVSFGANTKALVRGPLIDPSPQQTELFGQVLQDTSQPIVQYTSFDNQTVLGTYTVVPDLQMGLVTEIPIQPILDRLNNLPYFSLLLVGSVLLASVLVWIGSQRLTRPILEIAQAAQHFAEGDWLKRAVVDRNDEIGLLAYSFNNMADEISRLYRSLEIQVEERTQQILTAAEVARAALAAQDLNELLQRTVQLIVERFGFYYAAIFLVDELRENVILRDSYSAAAGGPIEREFSSLPLGPGSLVGLVASTNRPHVADDVEQDPDYLKIKELPDTRSEAVLPLSLGDEVLGVLDVQSTQPRAFTPETLATLQTLANQITAALRNFRLLEASQVNLQLTTTIYDISHQIAEAETQEEVYERLAEALQSSPYITAIFRLEESRMTALAMRTPGQTPPRSLPALELPRDQIQRSVPLDRPLLVLDDASASDLPKPLLAMPRRLGCQAFSLFPIAPQGRLEALLILGATDRESFSRANLDPYVSLVDITRTTLEKVRALETIQQRLSEIETINAVGQAISTETDLDTLFAAIHRQVLQVMGEVNFLIALYNDETQQIEIPYMDEGGGQILSIPPFPLGKGLTSIVIRTREPLMLVEDTEARSKALGAIVTAGGAAKSWLGVPLLVGGEPIGAIVVQDLEREHRFDDNDLRLLLTLASQVAVAIRNVRLLEQAEQQANQERRLLEISTRLQRVPDLHTIVQTAGEEIGKALAAHRTQIRVHLDENGDAPNQEEA